MNKGMVGWSAFAELNDRIRSCRSRWFTSEKWKHNPWMYIFAGTATVVFLVGLLSTVYAPGFSGSNRLDNIQFWEDNDPGGYYLQSAHQILRKPPVFNGHPATPMQIGNAVVQKIIWWIYGGDNESYTQCIVRKYYLVQVFSRLIVIVFWLASALLIKIITARMLKIPEVGYIAGILFITLFPVIYFINRISTEAFMTFFFLLTVYFLILAKETLDERNYRKSILLFVGAEVASIAAFFSKIHLFGPFPFYVFFVLIAMMSKKLSFRQSALSVFMVLVASSVTIWFFNQFMDWKAFTQDWFSIATYGNSPGNDVVPDLIGIGVIVIKRIGSVISHFRFSDFIPFTDLSRIIFATESSLFMLFLLSFGFREIRQNKVLMMMNIYQIFPVYIYLFRSMLFENQHGFHYLFSLYTLMCIQVAYLIYYGAMQIKGKAVLSGLILILIIHYASLTLGFKAHRDRAQMGETARIAYLYLLQLKPGEKPDAGTCKAIPNMGIMTYNYYNSGEPSLIELELGKLINDQQ